MSRVAIMAMDANRERAPRKVQGLVMACDRSRDLVAVVARTFRWDWSANSGRTKCDAIRFYDWNEAVRSGGSEMSLLDGTLSRRYALVLRWSAWGRISRSWRRICTFRLLGLGIEEILHGDEPRLEIGNDPLLDAFEYLQQPAMLHRVSVSVPERVSKAH